ncbi:Olfactory receptor 52N4 [Chelonia mydas]|uniref:Olfactory receptor 52N4 n=1 Tax=Chelonia mydas TaxID=8469 RepID=M7BZW3_CHEMY|nr:Olfactory receptor 52N4 [Chelonia mydas]
MQGTGTRPQQHLLMTCNDMDLEQVISILVGILGLENFPCWIAIRLCSMWVLTLRGNCTVLLIVKTEVSLCMPMYFFLSMLAINDPVITTSTLPKMLSVLHLGSQEISFNTCLLEMYFTHTFPIIKPGTFLATACVRYVAICCLLQYATILSNPAVVKMGLVAATAGGVILVIPCPVLILRLPCFRKVIPHTY